MMNYLFVFSLKLYFPCLTYGILLKEQHICHSGTVRHFYFPWKTESQLQYNNRYATDSLINSVRKPSNRDLLLIHLKICFYAQKNVCFYVIQRHQRSSMSTPVFLATHLYSLLSYNGFLLGAYFTSYIAVRDFAPHFQNATEKS